VKTTPLDLRFIRRKKNKRVQILDTFLFGVDTSITRLGVRVKDAKHCFANPFIPTTCLFVALGIYFACNSTLQPGNLFVGSNQKVILFQHFLINLYF
jgi:hypothetical protein